MPVGIVSHLQYRLSYCKTQVENGEWVMEWESWMHTPPEIQKCITRTSLRLYAEKSGQRYLMHHIRLPFQQHVYVNLDGPAHGFILFDKERPVFHQKFDVPQMDYLHIDTTGITLHTYGQKVTAMDSISIDYREFPDYSWLKEGF